jgi:hypothetical protein
MTPARLEELRQMAGAVDGPKSVWMDELIEEVDRLRGPFTCGHPPEFAGGACAVCQAELLEKIEAANLQNRELAEAKGNLLDFVLSVRLWATGQPTGQSIKESCDRMLNHYAEKRKCEVVLPLLDGATTLCGNVKPCHMHG